MTREGMQEANIVDLSDEELKEFLGHTYHALKNLDEQKKNDGEIETMREALRAYMDEVYNESIKALKARLKAARNIAAARGIKWRLPETAA